MSFISFYIVAFFLYSKQKRLFAYTSKKGLPPYTTSLRFKKIGIDLFLFFLFLSFFLGTDKVEAFFIFLSFFFFFFVLLSITKMQLLSRKSTFRISFIWLSLSLRALADSCVTVYNMPYCYSMSQVNFINAGTTGVYSDVVSMGGATATSSACECEFTPRTISGGLGPFAEEVSKIVTAIICYCCILVLYLFYLFILQNNPDHFNIAFLAF